MTNSHKCQHQHLFKSHLHSIYNIIIQHLGYAQNPEMDKTRSGDMINDSDCYKLTLRIGEKVIVLGLLNILITTLIIDHRMRLFFFMN